MRPVALTIAGSDPGGGAGIQADLKTFHQLGVYGQAAITLITVQNTIQVSRVECLNSDLVKDQIQALFEDFSPQAIKTGALGNAAIISAIANLDLPAPLVIDPVMVSKHGNALLPFDATEVFIRELLPRAFLLTPNLQEAAALTGFPVQSLPDMYQAAECLHGLGAKSVLVKGGHLDGDAVDVLFSDGAWTEFAATRLETRHTHGTGCTYSAAITAYLARGFELKEAVSMAKRYITEAIRTNPGLGRGSGPVNHWV